MPEKPQPSWESRLERGARDATAYTGTDRQKPVYRPSPLALGIGLLFTAALVLIVLWSSL